MMDKPVRTATFDHHVVPVSAANAVDFVAYCRAHGAEHDESYLPQADFVPGPEYPAYILMPRGGSHDAAAGGERPAGAACLIREAAYVGMRIARFMILHVLQPSREAYSALLAALAPHLADLDFAFGFIPEGLTAVRDIWEELGFQVERYAYVLEHPGTAASRMELPEGCRFEGIDAFDDDGLAAVCEILNLAFAGRPQRVDATPAYLARELSRPYGLPGGLQLLYGDGRPLATVQIERDDEPGAAAINGVAVHPAYQGRGLGRLLVRQALAIAHRHDLHPVYLSVSAANETAISLYVSEGFQKTRVMVCYRWHPAFAREPYERVG